MASRVTLDTLGAFVSKHEDCIGSNVKGYCVRLNYFYDTTRCRGGHYWNGFNTTASTDYNNMEPSHYVLFSYTKPVLVYDFDALMWVQNAQHYSRTTTAHLKAARKYIPEVTDMSEANIHRMLRRGGYREFMLHRFEGSIQFPLFSPEEDKR